MKTSDVLQAIRYLPDDAQVTLTVQKADLVRALTTPAAAETFDGIGTAEAAEILDVQPRKARRLHARWERMQLGGYAPPVRVSRKNPGNPNSDLLFDRDDCLAYATAGLGAGRLTIVPDADDPNDPDAIAASLTGGPP